MCDISHDASSQILAFKKPVTVNPASEVTFTTLILILSTCLQLCILNIDTTLILIYSLLPQKKVWGRRAERKQRESEQKKNNEWGNSLNVASYYSETLFYSRRVVSSSLTEFAQCFLISQRPNSQTMIEPAQRNTYPRIHVCLLHNECSTYKHYPHSLLSKHSQNSNNRSIKSLFYISLNVFFSVCFIFQNIHFPTKK